MKIRGIGAELFREDRQTDEQTDMTNLTVAFFCCCKFTNAVKNVKRRSFHAPLTVTQAITYTTLFCPATTNR